MKTTFGIFKKDDNLKFYTKNEKGNYNPQIGHFYPVNEIKRIFGYEYLIDIDLKEQNNYKQCSFVAWENFDTKEIKNELGENELPYKTSNNCHYGYSHVHLYSFIKLTDKEKIELEKDVTETFKKATCGIYITENFVSKVVFNRTNKKGD